MSVNKKTVNVRNRYLDIIRAFACIAVLLYHLGVLPGGYLAVCSFFVLSGYLTCRSMLKQRPVVLKKYYIGRVKRVWLPLALVCAVTAGVAGLFKELVWVSIKRETISVLLGYNNFWQILSNQDYFAAHTNSPFMHFWYTAILMQFLVLFPAAFVHLSKLGRAKMNRMFGYAAAASLLLFLGFGIFGSILNFYYNTFSRVFSLLIGVVLCLNHKKLGKIYDLLQINSVKKRIAVLGGMLALVILYIAVPADSFWMYPAMLVVSILTGIMIDISSGALRRKTNRGMEVLTWISDRSYEIYLVQYPIIYFTEYAGVFESIPALRIVVNLVLTFAFAVVLHEVLGMKKNMPVVKKAMCAAVLLFGVYGCVNWVLTKDLTADMKALEAELAANAEAQRQQQLMYEEKLKNLQEELEVENQSRQEELDSITKKLGSLHDDIENFPLVAIGDSVLLSASPMMYETFPNLYCDAKVSRSAWAAKEILDDLLNRNMLSDMVLFNLGANGAVPDSVIEEMLDTCGDRTIFLVNVTNDGYSHSNGQLTAWAEARDNVTLIDWNGYSSGHPEYFVSDGLHLQPDGQKAYAKCVFEAIYNQKARSLLLRKSYLENIMRFEP